MLRTTIDELAGFGPRHPIGRSLPVRIEQARIDAFAEATDDKQWIHVDPERAALGVFGSTIAHGYLTLSLLSRFLAEVIDVEDAATAINYGVNRVRFPSPVRVDEEITATWSIVEVVPVAGGVQVTFEAIVGGAAASKPALVAEILTRFLRE